MYNFRKTNDPILRKFSDGRTVGQTDRETDREMNRQMDESDFIGLCPTNVKRSKKKKQTNVKRSKSFLT